MARANKRRAEISLAQAKIYNPGVLPPSAPQGHHGVDKHNGDTTHISVIDHEGNAVSLTCSLGNLFGSAVVVNGAGFLLNNISFDVPGNPDEARGGARMATAEAPIIVTRGNQLVLVTGAAGGYVIPKAIVNTIVNRVDFGQDVAHAIDTERIECTNDPATDCLVEGGRMLPTVLDELRHRGHTLFDYGEYGTRGPAVGEVQGATQDRPNGDAIGASDPRKEWGAVAPSG